jgi:pyruvate dehydrogenase E2 component (dihydrolipoamide acetyltransferase)
VALEFRLPDIGEGLVEAEIVEWHVEVGAQVSLDQPLVQVETDKAVTEVPSPKGGVLLHQGALAGQVLRVGEILAVIGEPGESWEPAGKERVREVPGSAPIVGTLPEEAARLGAAEALPVVRRLARDLGIDLGSVHGTGPGGRVTHEDVELAAGRGPQGPGAEERVRLSRLRRTIAERMVRSWREIPHVTTFGEVDASRLLTMRRDVAARAGTPIPLEALLVLGVLPALRRHPEFNAALEGGDLVLKRHYDIGIAVDTAEGLIVPVLKGADRLNLLSLSEEVVRLSEATKARTVTAAELAGATFTISNIGAVGGGFGTPIIPYGTTAIISFGRAQDRPVARDGSVEIAPLMPLSLSYDHRVIDGALGRRFLAIVVEGLEDPTRLAG